MNRPNAYILVGVSASGKSTWVEKNKTLLNGAVYISTDKYVEKYAEEMGKTYSEVFDDVMGRAVSDMLVDVEEAYTNNRDVVWDQTSTTVLSRAKKLNRLKGYHMIAVVFKTPDAEELNRRLASRPGKVVPQQVVEDMINRFEMPTEKEGFREIWYV